MKYIYAGIPNKSQPWPDEVVKIKERIENESWLNFNNCLLNYYRTGKDSIDWHKDKELTEFTEIAIISLGETRILEVEKKKIILEPGSLLIFNGLDNHRVPKMKYGERISLTFRNIVK